MAVCAKCGAELAHTATFCSVCGTRAAPTSPPPPPMAVQSSPQRVQKSGLPDPKASELSTGWRDIWQLITNLTQTTATAALAIIWVLWTIASVFDVEPTRTDISGALFSVSWLALLAWLIALEFKHRTYVAGGVFALISVLSAVGVVLELFDRVAKAHRAEVFLALASASILIALALGCIRATYLFRKQPERIQPSPSAARGGWSEASPARWFMTAIGAFFVWMAAAIFVLDEDFNAYVEPEERFLSSEVLGRPGISDFQGLTVTMLVDALSRLSMNDGTQPTIRGWTKDGNVYVLHVDIQSRSAEIEFVHDLSEPARGATSLLRKANIEDQHFDGLAFITMLSVSPKVAKGAPTPRQLSAPMSPAAVLPLVAQQPSNPRPISCLDADVLEVAKRTAVQSIQSEAEGRLGAGAPTAEQVAAGTTVRLSVVKEHAGSPTKIGCSVVLSVSVHDDELQRVGIIDYSEETSMIVEKFEDVIDIYFESE